MSANPSPQVVQTVAELRHTLAAVRREGRRIGFVPTMGALHEGHLSLVRASKAECGYTVVSIYVNPSQFAPTEDLAKYPRTLQADLDALADGNDPKGLIRDRARNVNVELPNIGKKLYTGGMTLEEYRRHPFWKNLLQDFRWHYGQPPEVRHAFRDAMGLGREA